jgi:plastocyanin
MSHRPRRPLTTRFAAIAVSSLLALTVSGVAMGAAGATTSRQATTTTSGSAATPITKVTIKAYKFRPNKFAVTVGTPVTVTNKDGVQHDLAAVNGKFKTKLIDGGKSAKFTVKKPGTYKFVCTLHPYMTGVLTAS